MAWGVTKSPPPFSVDCDAQDDTGLAMFSGIEEDVG